MTLPQLAAYPRPGAAAQDVNVGQPDREHVLVGPAQRAEYQMYTRQHDAPALAGGTVLLYCEKQFKRVKGFAGIAQVIATIEAEQAEQHSAPTKKAA